VCRKRNAHGRIFGFDGGTSVSLKSLCWIVAAVDEPKNCTGDTM
jgi:hypothetical protein